MQKSKSKMTKKNFKWAREFPFEETGDVVLHFDM